MSLQHQRISELCADFKLEHIASEWPTLAQKSMVTPVFATPILIYDGLA
ncbi:TPA: hypothetical protein PXO92_004572 [Yersinia enterocolitica]|nr:hypothetical protein [Yersinia enterocolitica]